MTPRYRAAPPDQLLIVPLDQLTLAYHRPAGATHLLAEPAPQLIAALQDGAAGIGELIARFGLGGDAAPVLAERLDELVATGLIERI